MNYDPDLVRIFTSAIIAVIGVILHLTPSPTQRNREQELLQSIESLGDDLEFAEATIATLTDFIDRYHLRSEYHKWLSQQHAVRKKG